MTSAQRNLLIAVAAIAAVVVAPMMVSLIRLPRLTEVLAFVVAFAGLHVLSGRLGLISIGHAGFVGIGAIAAAISINSFGFPYLSAPLIGAIGAGVAGAIIAVPSLKLPGTYLALLTLSVAMAVPIAMRRVGSLGVVIDGGIVPPSWTGLAENQTEQWQYGLVAAITIITIGATALALNGPFGRALIAIKDEPVAAAAFGINVARTQIIGVGLASALAGVAGGLLVFNTPFVSAENYPLDRSLAMFALMIALGSRSLISSVPAAIVLVMLPELLVELGWSSFEPIIYGLMLLIMTRTVQQRSSLLAMFQRSDDKRPPPTPKPTVGAELEFVDL